MRNPEIIYPEQFARPYIPLKQELRNALELSIPRFGKSPRVAFFKLTDSCQMDCNYCDANEIKGKPLSTQEVFNVLDNLADAGIQMVDLSGGEPTLRPDLPEIIAHSKKLGMITTLSTNGGIGEKVDYAYWHKLAEAGLFGANISYDGVGEKDDPKAIHLAAFLVNTLHIYGGIRTVVWKENLDKVYEIGQQCMRNNVFFQAVPAVAIGGQTSAKDTDFTPLDYEGRHELAQTLLEVTKTRGPFANFLRVPKSYLKEVVDSPNPNSWHCKHPSSHWVSVDAQGRARVCNEIPFRETYLLTGKENPLKDKQLHKDADKESKDCCGCSWLCHWDGNRGQLGRGLDHMRLMLTIGGLT